MKDTRPALQQVIVRMPPEMHEAIKEAAVESDLTMSQVVRAAVRRYLADVNLKTA